MKLFVFGLGYSARHFLARFAGDFSSVTGTVRTTAARDAWQGRGCESLLFGPDGSGPAIAHHLATVDHMLVSVPPGPAGDPVLAAFGAQIATSGIRRIVYLSTVGVYGNHDGGWIDEAAPNTAEHGRGKARTTAEAAWTVLTAGRTTMLRLAGIYGPRRNALLNLRAGTARRIVKPGQVFNRIHVEDIASAIDAAFAHDNTGTWNVCDDEPAPPQDVVTFAATLMGIAPPPEVDLAAADMSDMARSFYQTNNRISNARLKHELNVTLAYPTYREGLEALWTAGEGR